MPHDRWTKEFKGMRFTAYPHGGNSPTIAQAFYAVQWMWLWMADLIPGHPADSGFFERTYCILDNATPAEDKLGYFRVEHAQKTNTK